MQLRRILLPLTLLLGCPVGAMAFLAEVLTVGKIVKEVIGIWNDVKEDSIGNQKVLQGTNQILNSLHVMESRFDASAKASVDSLARDLSKMLSLNSILNNMKDSATRVNTAEQRMRRYIRDAFDGNNNTQLEQHTLEDFAKSMVSHSSGSVLTQIDRLNSLIQSEDRYEENLVQQLTLSLKKEQCDMKKSPQQILFNLYRFLDMIQLKGFVVTQFAWMILRMYNLGNFTKEIELSQETYEDRRSHTFTTVKDSIGDLSREVWRCDPSHHEEGESYEEITGLARGHVQNDGDMTKDGTCYYECKNFISAPSKPYYDERVKDKLPTCDGTLHNCEFIENDMNICISRTSSHPYSHIRYSSGKQFGQGKSCSSNVAVQSWTRFTYQCSYCFCLCVDSNGQNSHRYFSLRTVESDISRNMVITGVRLRKVRRVIHFQIQQGKLLPEGKIDSKTLVWKRIDDFDINRSFPDRDYAALSWTGIRRIRLENQYGGDVVTGVRFMKRNGYLTLQVRRSEANFGDGILKHSGWNSGFASNYRDVSFEKSGLPIDTASDYYSKNGDVITFDTTSKIDDASQSVVPFLDIQQVTTDPPVPLAGIGLYHKGGRNKAGFIAPKAITYNYDSVMRSMSNDF